MDEECFMKVASEIARRALQGVSEVVYRATIEELRTSDASYLTGVDVSRGMLREIDSWRRVETYRELREYLRGDLEKWEDLRLIYVLSDSLSKASIIIAYFSIMDLVGDGCWSSGKDGVDRALVDSALDISMSFRKRTESGNLTWLTLAKHSLFYPMCYFVGDLQYTVQVENWRESDGYAESLKRLGGLLFWTVVYDAWLRERTVSEDAAMWHYDNDVYERLDQYEALDWSDIADDYAPYALLIQPFYKSLEEVVLEGGLRAWRVRVNSENLTGHAQQMKYDLELFPPFMKETTYKKYEDVISEILSGRRKDIAASLKRIAGLWNGWVGSMYRGIAKASLDGEALYLLMKEPPLRRYPFDGPLFMRMTASSLAISRQLVHIYSHMGKLFAEKAKRERPGEIAKGIERRLAPLYSKRRGWSTDELQRIPTRPLPSIYEQVLHTPTVAVGMAYGALSSISLALELDPKIPPDPLDLVELAPVKEGWGKYWSELTRPEFSRSLDLLKASARLPIGYLERLYDYIEMVLTLLPLPASPWDEAEEP
jgi:hypothetical protein